MRFTRRVLVERESSVESGNVSPLIASTPLKANGAILFVFWGTFAATPQWVCHSKQRNPAETCKEEGITNQLEAVNSRDDGLVLGSSCDTCVYKWNLDAHGDGPKLEHCALGSCERVLVVSWR